MYECAKCGTKLNTENWIGRDDLGGCVCVRCSMETPRKHPPVMRDVPSRICPSWMRVGSPLHNDWVESNRD
jgi:hypothetical protein